MKYTKRRLSAYNPRPGPIVALNSGSSTLRGGVLQTDLPSPAGVVSIGPPWPRAAGSPRRRLVFFIRGSPFKVYY